MRYCKYCGKEIMDQAVICPHCGCPQNDSWYSDDKPSIILNIIGFLFPVAGLVLYLIYEDKAPIKAKSIGKWSIWGVIFPIIFSIVIVFMIINLGLFASLM